MEGMEEGGREWRREGREGEGKGRDIDSSRHWNPLLHAHFKLLISTFPLDLPPPLLYFESLNRLSLHKVIR